MRTSSSFSLAPFALLLLAFPAVALLVSQQDAEQRPLTERQVLPPGYVDTPELPGGWRVHDVDRPYPPLVIPGTAGTAERRGRAPSDALVLFDGHSLEQWRRAGRPGEPAAWEVEDGILAINGTGSIQTRLEFGDCQLFVEWRVPEGVEGSSQGRGNSGVFLMGRYELQILDSYDNETYADGSAAALYGQMPPLVNACRPPGEWQTYEIVFRAPRFEGEELVRPARVTLLHNGVLVHDAQAFLGATTHRALAKYSPHPPAAPVMLQDHGDRIEFRHIWIRPLD